MRLSEPSHVAVLDTTRLARPLLCVQYMRRPFRYLPLLGTVALLGCGLDEGVRDIDLNDPHELVSERSPFG